MLKIPILAALISLQSANYIPKIEKEILSILSEQTTNKEKIESEPTLQDFVPKTVFVGDSWTAGYTRGLKNANIAAYPGKSSNYIANHFPENLGENIEYVVLLSGINNAHDWLDVTMNTIEMIVNAEQQNKKVIVCGLWNGKMLLEKDQTKVREKIAIINSNLEILGNKRGAYIDLGKEINNLKTGNIKAEYDSGDGLHLNALGNQIVQKLIAQKISELEITPQTPLK